MQSQTALAEQATDAGPDEARMPGGRSIGMQHLPEELIEKILYEIKGTSPNTQFWACLRTCQQWHRIGLGIHGELDVSTCTTIESASRRENIHSEDRDLDVDIVSDFDLGHFSPQFISELRSLTVHVVHPRIAASFRAATGREFTSSLISILRTTRKLITFSLKYTDDGWDFPTLDVPALPSSHLARITAALPRTVENLELDTAGTDIPPSQDIIENLSSLHLCDEISDILPRLRNLRLRVGHVCGALIPSHISSSSSSPPSSPACNLCPADVQSSKCSTASTWKMENLTVWIPFCPDYASGPGSDPSSHLATVAQSNSSFISVSQSYLLLSPQHFRFTVVVQDRWGEVAPPDITSYDNKLHELCSIYEGVRYIKPTLKFSWTGWTNYLDSQSGAETKRIAGYVCPETTYAYELPFGPSILPPKHAQRNGENGEEHCTYFASNPDPRALMGFKTGVTIKVGNHSVIPPPRLSIRYFRPTAGSTPRSTSPTIAIWTVEAETRWCQNRYLGSRYPVSLSPKNHIDPAHHPTLTHAELDELRSSSRFHCPFPGCIEQCWTVLHLLGHMSYSHPEKPHHGCWYGMAGCPSIGCNRVGKRGFRYREDIAEHLDDHGWIWYDVGSGRARS